VALRLAEVFALCRKRLLLEPPRDFIGAVHYFTRADRDRSPLRALPVELPMREMKRKRS
jgi:hypothetical protein